MSSDIHALSGAYAIDALDDVERADFERHLAQCAACRAEVDGLRAAATEMSALASAAPPPELRARVLADAATVRPLPPLVTGDRRPRRRLAAVLGAAAAVVALAGGAVVWHPWENSSNPSVTRTALQDVMAAPDAQRFETTVAAGGTLTLYRSVSLDRVVALTHGLPAAPPGRVYELWLQDAHGRMRPAGLMAGGSDDSVTLHGPADTAEAAGVTVEPAGGSRTPTTKPIALIAFA